MISERIKRNCSSNAVIPELTSSSIDLEPYNNLFKMKIVKNNTLQTEMLDLTHT